MMKKLIIFLIIILVSGCSVTVSPKKIVVVDDFSETGSSFALLAYSGVEMALSDLDITEEYTLDFVDISEYASIDDLEQAILDINADVYIGPNFSSVLADVYPIYKNNELFAFIPGASADTINEEDDYVFRFLTSTSEQARQFANLMNDRYQTGSIIYENINLAYSQVISESIQSQASNVINSIDPISEDMSAEDLIASIDPNSEAIVLISSAKTAGIVIQRLRSSGIDIPIYMSGWAQSNTLIEFVGDYTENSFIFSNGYPSKEDNYNVFKDRYLEEYGTVTGHIAMYSYDFMVILNDYIKAGNSFDKEAFKTYMTNNPHQEGYLYSIELNEYGMGTQTMQLLEIKDGEFVQASH